MPGWCWCRAAAVSPRLPASPTTIGPCCGTKWTSPAARCARSRLATSSTWARWAISCANCMCTSSRVAKAMPHGPGRSGVTARRSPMATLPCTNAWPRCAMHWRCRRSVETAHIQFERLDEDALLLRFGERIDATINARVQVAVDVLQHRLPSLECVPAYASVLLRFDPLACTSTARTWNESSWTCTGASTATPTGRHRPDASTSRKQMAACGLWGAALEDKIVQRAVVEVLNAVYEQDFLGLSYGFRPQRSQHQALDALSVGITRTKVGWIVDADIKSFFDTVSHEWLIKFVEHRIGDPRIVRLIGKWLKAGTMEQGTLVASEEGTPQGAVISPLLANIYLHYVFDLWAHQWRRRHARGNEGNRALCRRHRGRHGKGFGRQAIRGGDESEAGAVLAGAAP